MPRSWSAAALPPPTKHRGFHLRGPPAPARRLSRAAQSDDRGVNITDLTDVTDVHEPVKHEEPWTLQQLISIVSGFIGSILSLNAYSQLREATKQREAIARVNTSQRAQSSSLSTYNRNARIVQQLLGCC